MSSRACDLEDGEACWLLSTWYMGDKTHFKTMAQGENKVGMIYTSYLSFTPRLQKMDDSKIGKLERDMNKSLQYAIRACDYDIPQSCANVAR